MIITHIVRARATSVVMSAVVFGGCSEAQQAPAGIVVEDPWAATTAPGATVAAGYVTLRNTSSEPAHLVSASSPRAERVELHEMSMEGGMMRMRPVDAIVIPAGGAVTLAPGGLHIMFLDINAPFANGERIPVTLQFVNGATEVAFVARPRGARSGGHEH